MTDNLRALEDWAGALLAKLEPNARRQLNQQIGRATKVEREGMEIGVIGAAQAPTLLAMLRQKNITVQQVDKVEEDGIGDLLRSRKLVVLRPKPSRTATEVSTGRTRR